MKQFKVFKYFIATILTFAFISCGGESEEDKTIIIPVAKVQAAFDMSISSTDPNILLLDNKTVGTGEFTSEWDYGQGGALVLDQPGIEEVRFDTDGTFSVRLIVTNAAGLTVDT